MGNSKAFFFLIALFCSGFSTAQVNRYMVFFADKEGTPYSITDPAAFLSYRAIERRANQGISITDSDLPVSPDYIDQVSNTGAEVLYQTKWMNGVLVSCDVSLIPTLTGLSHVTSVELVAPGAPQNGGRAKSVKKRTGSNDEPTTNQLSMIGINAMHADGFRGEGISIAVFDGGFLGANLTVPFAHIFDDGRFQTDASYNFIQRNQDVFQYDDHGTRVFSVIGAFQEGAFTGGAYKAGFQLYVTEDVNSEYRIEEYNWLFAAERADSAGADIINSSVGYSTFDLAAMDYTTSQMDGNTAVVTRAAQLATDKGIIVVTSAGNEGNDPAWRIITAPADGMDVLAVGNVNGSGLRNSSSSIGPTSDSRIKPDVMAMGSGTSVVKANGTIATASGTSFSSPLLAALAAGLWQRYPTMTNKELIEAIRLSSTQAQAPDNFMGYGIPNYKAVVNYTERFEQDELIAVFPNPVTDNTVIIRPNNPEEIQLVSYLLFNVTGQVIQQRELDFSWSDNQYAVDLSTVAAGIYILRVQTGETLLTFRLVRL